MRKRVWWWWWVGPLSVIIHDRDQDRDWDWDWEAVSKLGELERSPLFLSSVLLSPSTLVHRTLPGSALSSSSLSRIVEALNGRPDDLSLSCTWVRGQ